LRPYKLIKQNDFYYRFNSAAGTTYLCYFIKYDYLFTRFSGIAQNIYAFNLDIEKGRSKEQPLDERIGLTTAIIIKQFLQTHEKAVIYICDSSDYKEHIRKRKFDSWFLKNDDGSIIKIDKKAVVAETILYNSLLIHKDNPRKNQFIAAFNQLNDEMDEK
jgi:hypothetical protein